MIDVSRIRDLNKLKEMKDNLNFFINKKVISEIYDERGITDELEYDRGLARVLLGHVCNRIITLSQLTMKEDSKPLH